MTDPVKEALPCPFCGHTGLDFTEGSTFRWLAYSCGGCGIGSETRRQSLGEGTQAQWQAKAEADAIAEWNKRTTLHPDTEPAAQVAAESKPCPWTKGQCSRRGCAHRFKCDAETNAEKVRAEPQASSPQPEAAAVPVGEIVAFGTGLHEVSWARGKLPPLGTKLYTHPKEPT